MKSLGKQRTMKPFKNAAATFEARGCSAPSITLPEFKNTTPEVLDFHTKANLFAITLIRLWTGKDKHEKTNFIPLYEYCTKTKRWTELLLPTNVVPFHQQSATDMKCFFSAGFAQNLGSLSLLNVLMSSEFTGNSLGIVTSPRSNNPYFTQKLCPFWLDYFKDSNESYLFRSDLSERKLMGFTLDQTQKKWWDEALERNDTGKSPIELSGLFIEEMFETILRIMVTPNEFLREIANLTFGQDHLIDSFYAYFHNKLENFKSELLSLIDNDEKQAWQDYIRDKGRLHFSACLTEVSSFWVEEQCVIKNVPINIQESVMVNAMSQQIPNLENVCLVSKVKDYSLNHKIDCVYYFIAQANIHWSDVSTQPAHRIWLLLDQLADGLYDEMMKWILMPMKFTSETIPFLNELLIKSMEFKKNNITTLLVSVGIAIPFTPKPDTLGCTAGALQSRTGFFGEKPKQDESKGPGTNWTFGPKSSTNVG